MSKRNAKRAPVKPPPEEEEEEEEEEDSLEDLNLDDSEDSDEGEEPGADDAGGAGDDDSADEDEEADETASDAGEEDEIERAMLELMAAQAEAGQQRRRRAAAAHTAAADEGEEDAVGPSTATRGKSRAAAAGGAAAAAAGTAGATRSTAATPQRAAAAGGRKASSAAAAAAAAEADVAGGDAGRAGGAARAAGAADAAGAGGGGSDDDAAAAAAAADGAEEGPGQPVDPGSDSSEDERPNRNTVGKVPLEWYDAEEHIGYDIEGRRIGRPARADALQALLDRNDSKKALRTIFDPYNGEHITLSREELAMVMRIRSGQFPHVEVNPFEPYNDYFSRDTEAMPILDAPEPKRRFVPSQWEEKKIVKLVRAIRKGWIRMGPAAAAAREAAEHEPPPYLLWADDGAAGGEGPGGVARSGAGLTHIPAPKPALPGHGESYNPPAEYLPTEEEVAAWQMADPEDRPKALPSAFPSLRAVPAYDDYIRDRFERCLDLYLCPRVRRKRLDIKSPEALVPQLPKPADLQPFPTTLALSYEGHAGAVTAVAPDPWEGQWLATGGADGTLRLWEVRTGRCYRTWQLGGPVVAAAWCPDARLRLLSAAVGAAVVLLPSGTGPAEAAEAAEAALRAAAASTSGRPEGADGAASGELATWGAWSGGGGGVAVTLRFPLRRVAWHARGDYFATVAPTGNTQAVVVHQLSRAASQNPFRKNRGRVLAVAFHPAKPFFFVTTQNHVRVYNLAKQALAKKLLGGGGALSCIAVHPSGDHVVVGSDDKRVAWYDLDLSTKPYKAMRYHTQQPRAVAFHRSYPLFASAADDGTVQVFHGMVYADLLTNPLIVPVKILRAGSAPPAPGSGSVSGSGGPAGSAGSGGAVGIADVAFHPSQPWLFTAGTDGRVLLYCN